MSISGPQVHQQLMHAYAETQQRLESARGQDSADRDQRESLDDDRGEALVRLAEHYLPALTPEAVRETWIEIRPSMSQILQRKHDDVGRVHADLDILKQKRLEADSTLVGINEQLDVEIEAQRQLGLQVEQSLRSDAQFVQLSDRAAVAEAALERAEANLHEIDQDSARKLPAYEESNLFRYLHERGFGTPQYDKRGFTRRMDRWLAKMIDFNKAKQGYDFLRKTPEQMRQIIAEDRQALDVVMDELERRRDDVAAELGLPEKISRVEEIQTQRDQQLRSLDDLLSQANEKEEELTQLDHPRGKHYREAIELFRGMLDRISSRDLERRAQSTIEITDDQIVAQLIGVESEIDQLQQAGNRRRQELADKQDFLEGLGQLIQRFRAAGFDSSRSEFSDSLDILGAVQRADEIGDVQFLWEQLRSAQRWGPTAMEQISNIATHPLTQVLINAMAHAAGGAMEAHARRAGQRRGRQGGTWGGSWGGSSSGGYRNRR